MKTRIGLAAVLLVSAVLLSWADAFADGFMVSRVPSYILDAMHGHNNGADITGYNFNPDSNINPIVALSVKYHTVKVTVDNGVATTYVDEVFLNDFNVDIEGMYYFPLPEEATVKSFSIYVNGKKIEGKVMDKDQARAAYEGMVRDMREPALLEYVGRNLFKVSVYPIPAKGEKRVELIYQQVLKYDNGIYTYDYPLDTERFSPKPLENVLITANIKSNIPIKSVYSATHNIGLKLERGQATATYEDKNVKPDKNFILHYTVSDKDVGLNLMTYRKSAEDGYFMLLVSPGQLENRAMDKDIIFVIDSSGSMSGEKIGQAKDALRYCINNLKPGDRFSIVNFSTGISSFEDSLVTATKDKVNAALNFINDISGSGGTDINDALLTAFRMFNDPQRPRMIVFLTDGEPTEGVVGLKDIVENVKQANTLKTRIFVFGVGDNVNTHLLDKLAQVNRGISEYVLPNENIELKLTSFYRKISEPVLSDISIDFAGIKTKDLYPKDLPDIFKGSQLVVVGRYINSGPAKITLKGKINGAQKDFIYDVDFSEQDQTSDFIPRIWATRKIGYLLSEIRFTGANDELKNEIERLSKEFGIITPYTSFILDASQKQSSDSLGAHTSFYEQSYSKGMLGVSQSRGLSGSNLGTELTMRVSAGANAVKLAQGIGDMQSSAVLSASAALTVKQAGDKTFRMRDDGVWVDSSFKEGSKLIKVKYLSKEYFELLHKTALVAKYLSLGKNIIVVVDGQAYQVIE